MRLPRWFRVALPIAVPLAVVLLLQAPWFFARFGGSTIIELAPPAPAAAAVEPNRLRITRLEIDAPIIEPDGRHEAAYQRALQDGVAHFPGTATAGEPGNAYYFGHSSDYLWTPGTYKTVFARLTAIQKDDLIEVSDASGTPHAYKVLETKVVSPHDLSVLDQGDGTRRLLTLQTSYPLGTALRRFIVIAERAAP